MTAGKSDYRREGRLMPVTTHPRPENSTSDLCGDDASQVMFCQADDVWRIVAARDHKEEYEQRNL